MHDGRQIVESLLAVAGIWLVVYRLPDSAAMLLWSITVDPIELGSAPSAIALQSVFITASVVGGLLLITTRKLVARWLYPNESAVPIHSLPLVGAGAAVVACYMMVRGLVSLGTYYAYVMTTPGFDQLNSQIFWDGAIALTCGLVLFVLSPWLEQLWKRLRIHS